jgi:hypothetical protein
VSAIANRLRIRQGGKTGATSEGRVVFPPPPRTALEAIRRAEKRMRLPGEQRLERQPGEVTQ